MIVSQGFPAGLFPVTTLRANSTVQVAQEKKANQYTLEWFFDVQRQLPGNIVVTASYMGEGMRDIAWTQNLNTPLTPGPGVLQNRRPWPFFAAINYIPREPIRLQRSRAQSREALLQRSGIHRVLYLVA